MHILMILEVTAKFCMEGQEILCYIKHGKFCMEGQEILCYIKPGKFLTSYRTTDF